MHYFRTIIVYFENKTMYFVEMNNMGEGGCQRTAMC
jgi:hypothetical protein